MTRKPKKSRSTNAPARRRERKRNDARARVEKLVAKELRSRSVKMEERLKAQINKRLRKGINSYESSGSSSISPARLRADGWENVITGLGRSGFDKRSGGRLSVPRSTNEFQLFEDLFHGDDLANTCVATPAQEMVRAWINIAHDADDEEGDSLDKGGEEETQLGKESGGQSSLTVPADTKPVKNLWPTPSDGGTMIENMQSEARPLKQDADWDEEQHPRGEDGRFGVAMRAYTGAMGEGEDHEEAREMAKKAVMGAGASEEEAEAHMERVTMAHQQAIVDDELDDAKQLKQEFTDARNASSGTSIEAEQEAREAVIMKYSPEKLQELDHDLTKEIKQNADEAKNAKEEIAKAGGYSPIYAEQERLEKEYAEKKANGENVSPDPTNPYYRDPALVLQESTDIYNQNYAPGKQWNLEGNSPVTVESIRAQRQADLDHRGYVQGDANIIHMTEKQNALDEKYRTANNNAKDGRELRKWLREELKKVEVPQTTRKMRKEISNGRKFDSADYSASTAEISFNRWIVSRSDAFPFQKETPDVSNERPGRRDPGTSAADPEGDAQASEKLAASSDEDSAQEDAEIEEKVLIAKKTLQKLEQLEAQTKTYEAIVWANVFGGSLMFLGIDDGGDDDPASMSLPLNEDNIKTFNFISIFDRWDVDVYTWYRDPKHPKFGLPESYRIRQTASAGGTSGSLSGDIIHESRCIRFEGAMVNRRRRVRNAGWADSVYIRLADVIRDFAMAYGGVAHLLQDFAQAIFKMKGLAEALSADQGDLVLKRMHMMDMSRGVARAVPIDADGEEFERHQTPVAGMPDLLDRFCSRLASAARIPVTMLMGESPAGLNATGASDIRIFYDHIRAMQERILRPRLNRLITLIFKTKDGPTSGKVPDNWSIKFNPLWQTSDSELATLRSTQANTDKLYHDMGVLTEKEIAQSRFGGDAYSTETVLDTEQRAQDANDDAKLQSALKDAYDNGEPPPPNPDLPPPPMPPAQFPPPLGGPPIPPVAQTKADSKSFRTRHDAPDRDYERDEKGRFSSGGSKEAVANEYHQAIKEGASHDAAAEAAREEAKVQGATKAETDTHIQNIHDKYEIENSPDIKEAREFVSRVRSLEEGDSLFQRDEEWFATLSPFGSSKAAQNSIFAHDSAGRPLSISERGASKEEARDLLAERVEKRTNELVAARYRGDMGFDEDVHPRDERGRFSGGTSQSEVRKEYVRARNEGADHDEALAAAKSVGKESEHLEIVKHIEEKTQPRYEEEASKEAVVEENSEHSGYDANEDTVVGGTILDGGLRIGEKENSEKDLYPGSYEVRDGEGRLVGYIQDRKEGGFSGVKTEERFTFSHSSIDGENAKGSTPREASKNFWEKARDGGFSGDYGKNVYKELMKNAPKTKAD